MNKKGMEWKEIVQKRGEQARKLMRGEYNVSQAKIQKIQREIGVVQQLGVGTVHPQQLKILWSNTM